MSNHLYKEMQKLRQPWIFILLIGVFGLWMWQLIQQVIMGVPFGDDPAPNWAILLVGLIPVGAFLLLLMLKLETVVEKDRLMFRMWPLHQKFKEIKAGDIEHWEVKKYNPIRDYGGWGIRQGFGRKGVAYNISGRQGALFELKNGKSILIGTRKPEELRSALRKMLANVADN